MRPQAMLLGTVVALAALATGWALEGRDDARTLDGSPSIRESEQVTYSVAFGGRSFGTLEVRYSWTTMGLVGNVSLLGPNAFASEASGFVLDVKSGQVVSVTSEFEERRPIGVRSQMPSPDHPIHDEPAPGMPYEMLPLGPQWALLHANHTVQPRPWGSIAVTEFASKRGWALLAEGTCDDCEDTQDTAFAVTMRGPAGHLLPDEMHDSDFGGFALTLMALDRHAGDAVETPALSAPELPAAAPDRTLCGFTACEGDALADRYSLLAGIEALETTPEWIQWRPGRGSVAPCDLTIGSSPAGVKGSGLLALTWLLVFEADGEAAQFQLYALAPVDGVHTPPRLIGFQPSYTYDRSCSQPPELSSPSEAVRQAQAVRSCPNDTTHVWSLTVQAPGPFRAPRNAFTWHYNCQFPPDGSTSVHVGAIDAWVKSIQPVGGQK